MSVTKVFQKLKDSNQSLSLIESCTGGGLSSQITFISGASNHFIGGMVPYQDASKINNLKIDAGLIEEKTSVSSEVVLQMAQKGSDFFKSSWCLATSGWAGPGGGTAADPVGTVYFAVVGPGHESVERRTFSGSNTRKAIVEWAIENAWSLLLEALVKQDF